MAFSTSNSRFVSPGHGRHGRMQQSKSSGAIEMQKHMAGAQGADVAPVDLGAVE